MIKTKLKKFFKALGPGFITGASDDDPSGIATYSQTGAQFGFSQLWMALFSIPFMTVIQEMCGRIGLVTGQGLAGVIRKHYSKKILFFTITLLLIANGINIGADLGAMAAALQLLIPAPFAVLLIMLTALTLILQIFVSYPVYVKYLKFLALTLLAYVVTIFVIHPNWGQVLSSTLIPKFSWKKEYLMNIVALLGTTISPYLFFWEADEEVEEEIEHGKIEAAGVGTPKITKRDIKHMKIDTFIGMLFSNIITFFIIVTAASTLGVNGVKNIETAAQAAAALKPLAGNFASLLFTVGIIGTGLLAVPVLSGSAAYAVTEARGWKSGLYRKFSEAKEFYTLITITTGLGVLINFLPISPFKLLYYTAIVNGAIAPILMIIIVRIAGNKSIMGRFVSSKTSSVLGWFITGVMSIASIALIISLFLK